MTIFDADLSYAKTAMWASKEFLTWRDLLLGDSKYFKLRKVVWDNASQCCQAIYTKPPGPRGKDAYLAEAIARMVSVRSRRRDRETGELRPVIDEWWKLVRLNFQPLFNRCSSGQLVGNGWVDLTLALADWVWPDRKPQIVPNIRFDDYASREGSLAADVTGYDADEFMIVEAFEGLSAHVCETCGALGRSRGGNYLVPAFTACAAHVPREDIDD